MKEELQEINVLEAAVAGNIKLKMEEEIQEELTNDYRDMMQYHKEMQGEKDEEIKKLNWEVNELRHLNRSCKERSRQQQERKMKVKRYKQKGDKCRVTMCRL